MQIQKLKSSKLFYNKWPYKISCRINGGSKISIWGLDATRRWCNSNAKARLSYEKEINKPDLLAFLEAVTPFVKNENVQIRVESNAFNLFCKDPSVLKEIDSRLQKWIRRIEGPTTQEEYDFLLENGYKKILVDKLPKDTYQYKIYFKPSYSLENRYNFLTWSKKYGNKVNISTCTERWFHGYRNWMQAPFMYVIDTQMLSMVGLFASGYVKKIEEFIPRNTILKA